MGQGMQVRRVWLCVLAAAVLTAGVPQRAQAQKGPDEARILLLQAKPKAYAIIEKAGRDTNARTRLAALEASQHAPDAAKKLALDGLTDDNPAVRFAALVTIGKVKITGLADAAKDMLKDENPSVRAAAIFALKRCGRKVDTQPLMQMLTSGRSSTRANAVMLVGQMGDASVIELLRDTAAKPMPRVSPAERTWVRLQFAEAMIRLDPDNEEVLGTIRAAVYSNLDDVRVLAMQILGEVGDKSVQAGLAHIIKRDNPVQIKIAAAQAMVRMGDRRGAATLLEGSLYDEKKLKKDLEDFVDKQDVTGPDARAIKALLEDQKLRTRVAAEVRAQATTGLGWVRNEAAAQRLTQLLDDPNVIVRLAAASAVLRSVR